MSTNKHVFGLFSLTAGQNVMTSLFGLSDKEVGIGIPEWNYGKLKEILRKALDDTEYEICVRGFGIGCKKQKQNEIADLWNWDASVVSKLARKAIEKLRRAPYDGMIWRIAVSPKKMMEEYISQRATIISLNERISELEGFAEASKEVESLSEKVGSLEMDWILHRSQISYLESSLKAARERAERSEVELAKAKEKVGRSDAEMAKADEAINTLKIELGKAQKRAERSEVELAAVKETVLRKSLALPKIFDGLADDIRKVIENTRSACAESFGGFAETNSEVV